MVISFYRRMQVQFAQNETDYRRVFCYPSGTSGIYLSNCVFPKLTPEAYRVMCSRMYPTAKDLKLDFLLSFQSYLAILDLQLRIEPMHGEIFLFDLEYLPLSQFVNLPPLMTKNYINMCFNSFPLSVKGFHFINPPKFIGKIMTLAKMLLPKKLKNRIYVHNTLESLYQFIPKDVLPDQYGGTAGDLRSIEDNWFEYTMANNEWLGNRPKADLSKRVGQLKLCELNVKDKFKKLEID
ncbi:Hypothetical protein CINCED_3A020519 [Cinara cedri]|uniref:CRAL-TRIO domain-containing protein n=1 Tax=Cinara cedri TaxID=506608 RepID=A0A5E4NE16_9HEMI|nr:Hypothetical protein CINCED_3A020519 [Cinara cedri]